MQTTLMSITVGEIKVNMNRAPVILSCTHHMEKLYHRYQKKSLVIILVHHQGLYGRSNFHVSSLLQVECLRPLCKVQKMCLHCWIEQMSLNWTSLWLHELIDHNLKRQRNREPRVSIRQAIQCSWATTKLKRTAETCWMPFDPWVEMNVGLGGTRIQKSYAVIVQASSAHKKVGEVDHMGVERSAADCLCECRCKILHFFGEQGKGR